MHLSYTNDKRVGSVGEGWLSKGSNVQKPKMENQMAKMKKLLILATIAAVATSASALDHFWQGDINDLWSEGNNWTDSGYSGADLGVPTALDNVTILNPPEYSSPARVVGPGAVAYHIFLGKWTHPGLLTVDAAGALAASGALIIADEVDGSGAVINNGQFDVADIIVMQGGIGDLVNNGTLTASDVVLGNTATSASTLSNTGDMTVDGWLHLSVAASNTVSMFNMDGGAVNITGKLQMNEGGRGHLNLHGGTITMAEFGLIGTGGYTIDIEEGVLVTGGDLVGGMKWMAGIDYDGTDGRVPALITAYRGAGTVVVEYDVGLNQTTLSAIAPVDDGLILGDTFDTGGVATNDLGYNLLARQSGVAAPATYSNINNTNELTAAGELYTIHPNVTEDLQTNLVSHLDDNNFSLKIDARLLTSADTNSWTSFSLISDVDNGRQKSPMSFLVRQNAKTNELIWVQYGTGSAATCGIGRKLRCGRLAHLRNQGHAHHRNQRHIRLLYRRGSPARNGWPPIPV